jgi:hypothetical protein
LTTLLLLLLLKFLLLLHLLELLCQLRSLLPLTLLHVGISPRLPLFPRLSW